MSWGFRSLEILKVTPVHCAVLSPGALANLIEDSEDECQSEDVEDEGSLRGLLSGI